MIRQPDGPLSAPHALAETPAAPSNHRVPAAQTVAPVESVSAEPTRVQLERAVAQANQQMNAVAPSLQFEIDPETREVIIRLVDKQDQRVLRQVPSAEMLAIARALERMHTLLVRTRA